MDETSTDKTKKGLGFYGELGLGVEPSQAHAALAAELLPAMAIKAPASQPTSAASSVPRSMSVPWAMTATIAMTGVMPA